VERVLLLLGLQPFQALTSEELAGVAARMIEMRFEAGDTIFTEGDAEGRLYIVIDGAAEQGLGRTPLRRTTKAMAFGIFGLLGVPTQEAAWAIEPTHVLVLTREDFTEALFDSPDFAVGCLRGVALALQEMARRVEALESTR
jgi:CRP-like cAMP-binding protein